MGVEVGGLAKLKLLEFSHILVLYFALSEVAVCIPIKYLGNLMKQKQEDAETEMRHLSLSLICCLSITVSKGVTRETIIQILTTFGIKFIFCSTIMSSGVIHILRKHFWGSWLTPPPNVILYLCLSITNNIKLCKKIILKSLNGQRQCFSKGTSANDDNDDAMMIIIIPISIFMMMIMLILWEK